MTTYKAVGIFEEWELSMQLFNATVKSSVRDWDGNTSLNHGVADFGREALLQWAYVSPDIHVELATDILLYDVRRLASLSARGVFMPVFARSGIIRLLRLSSTHRKTSSVHKMLR